MALRHLTFLPPTTEISSEDVKREPEDIKENVPEPPAMKSSKPIPSPKKSPPPPAPKAPTPPIENNPTAVEIARQRAKEKAKGKGKGGSSKGKGKSGAAHVATALAKKESILRDTHMEVKPAPNKTPVVRQLQFQSSKEEKLSEEERKRRKFGQGVRNLTAVARRSHIQSCPVEEEEQQATPFSFGFSLNV